MLHTSCELPTFILQLTERVAPALLLLLNLWLADADTGTDAQGTRCSCLCQDGYVHDDGYKC